MSKGEASTFDKHGREEVYSLVRIRLHTAIVNGAPNRGLLEDAEAEIVRLERELVDAAEELRAVLMAPRRSAPSAERSGVEKRDVDLFVSSLRAQKTPWANGCADLIEKLWASPSHERTSEPQGHDWQPDGGVLRFESHLGGETPHVHTTCAKCGARAWFLEYQWELLSKGCAASATRRPE